MTNGFYNSNNLSKVDKIKFLTRAINLSYLISCQSIIDTQRQINKSLYIDKVISDGLNTIDHNLYCIDRFLYNKGHIDKKLCDYEIILNYNSSHFLYIYVNENNFNTLIKEFNLKLIEYETN